MNTLFDAAGMGDEAPRPLAEEVAYWAPILAKAQEPGWLALGRRLGERLAQCQPAAGVIGLFHGDYQPGNVMYAPGPDGLAVSGVIVLARAIWVLQSGITPEPARDDVVVRSSIRG